MAKDMATKRPESSCACATLGVLVLASASPWVLAQEGVALDVASRITIVPRVSVTETITNNVRLSSVNQKSEAITEVSPGISISSTGGRIRGSIDYSLTEVLYANNTSGRRSLNSLTANGIAEVVDNWAFLDFSGNVGQQSISAFGTPSSGGALVGGNSTETSVFRLSPYLRGRFAGNATYEARYSYTTSTSRSVAVSDVDQRDLSFRASGGQSGYGLSWGLDASRQSTSFTRGRSTSGSVLNTRLQYALDERWGGYVRVGRESNDFAVANGESSNFVALGVSWRPNPELSVNVDQDNRGYTGLGINWAPSPRTSVAVTRDGRLYGATHSIALAYRTPLTAWTFSDSRGTSSAPAFGPGLQSVSLYDLLTNQFAATESDPIKREQYDAFLLANGIRPGLTAVGGFLASTLSLQQSRQMSFALFGARSTLTMVVSRSQNTKLDTLSTAVDDFITSSVVSQNGLSANYAYRLTPRTTLSLAASRQSSSGNNGVAGTSSRSFNLNLSTQLTREASASVGARRVLFDSATNPYSETAVTGTVQVQF
jgi:uncharacterized protein (PEP-CTERM system associated)